MRKPPEKPSDISQEDWDAVDVPEATAEDFARAQPFKEVFPEQYKAWKRMGRPSVESPKVHISFRLASDVVDGIRATGQGYNGRVEKVLRDALARGELNSRQKAPAPGRSPTLAERILALATGRTQQEIIAACKGAGPNHVRVAIARHRQAGRIEERDGKLYATHPTVTEQYA